MKPRLEHGPQTIEDFDVWTHVGHRFHPGFAWVELSNRSRLADRRDADLMLQAMKDRYVEVLVSATQVLPRISVSWPLPRRGMRWHK
jgi:hypothetical protein